MTVGNKLIDFLVDTGATYLVLNTKVPGKSSATVSVAGVTGQLQQKVFLQLLEYRMGDLKNVT